MPTILAEPPELRLRMAFMDALEDAGIEYERIPDGYVVFLRDSHAGRWDDIRARFSIPAPEGNPPLL